MLRVSQFGPTKEVRETAGRIVLRLTFNAERPSTNTTSSMADPVADFAHQGYGRDSHTSSYTPKLSSHNINCFSLTSASIVRAPSSPGFSTPTRSSLNHSTFPFQSEPGAPFYPSSFHPQATLIEPLDDFASTSRKRGYSCKHTVAECAGPAQDVSVAENQKITIEHSMDLDDVFDRDTLRM